jgi:hypothetical protein
MNNYVNIKNNHEELLLVMRPYQIVATERILGHIAVSSIPMTMKYYEEFKAQIVEHRGVACNALFE